MTNSKSISLVARAVLALVLTVGFYLLALAISGLLLFVIYLEISRGFVNFYLSIICLLAAGVILWSILPRPDRFEAPGPQLKPAEQPRLFKELNSTSQAGGAKNARRSISYPGCQCLRESSAEASWVWAAGG